jgi:DNA gyrase inhibitor GyrI
MRHAPASLSQIAIDCGFGSLSNFSRTFKKEYGSSPSKIKLDNLLKDRKIGQTHPESSRYHLHEFPKDERSSEFKVRIAPMADLHVAYIRCYGLGLDPQKAVDAYHRLMAWARSNPHVPNDSMVIGMSLDDPEITPLDKYRYDLCVTLDGPILPSGEIGAAVIPAARYAVHHCKGDILAFAHAWSYFFKVWFPQSGYRPAHQPAMEIFHSGPEEVGWDYFDIDCCVPIDPIAAIRDLWT